MDYDTILNKLIYIQKVHDSNFKMNQTSQQISMALTYINSISKHDFFDWKCFQKCYPDVAYLIQRI